MPTTGDALHHIMYTSTAIRPMDVTDLSDLLRQARDKNDRLGVTGMLLYRSGSFLQLIEGEAETLRGLYATIRDDARHRNVITLMDEAAEARDFESWTMGFRHLGDVGPGEMPEGFTSFMEKGFEDESFRSDPSYGRQMLLHFQEIDTP